MLLFNEVFFPHWFDSIIFVVFRVETKHDLSKGSSSKYFQELELFETVDWVASTFIFEN